MQLLMVSRQPARLCNWITQLIVYIWLPLHYAQYTTYNKYRIRLSHTLTPLFKCYDAIINAGVKRFMPVNIGSNSATIDIYTKTTFIQESINAILPGYCVVESFSQLNSDHPDAFDDPLDFAIFSSTAQRKALAKYNVALVKEYTIIWHYRELKLYWCRGMRSNIETLERSSNFKFTTVELLKRAMGEGEHLGPEFDLEIDQQLQSKYASSLLETLKDHNELNVEVEVKIDKMTKCLDVLRSCSANPMILSNQGIRKFRLKRFTLNATQKTLLRSKCGVIPACENDATEPPQILYQTNRRSINMAVVTFLPDQRIKCLQCCQKQGYKLSIMKTLFGIFRATTQIQNEYEAIVWARFACMHKENSCTSIMLRPESILPQLQGQSARQRNHASLSEDELAIYQVEVAEIGAVEYPDDDPNYIKCLFRELEIFHADKSDKILWTTSLYERRSHCDVRPLVIIKIESAYLPPRPMRYSDYGDPTVQKRNRKVHDSRSVRRRRSAAF